MFYYYYYYLLEAIISELQFQCLKRSLLQMMLGVNINFRCYSEINLPLFVQTKQSQ
jgi:hypothetical protein